MALLRSVATVGSYTLVSRVLDRKPTEVPVEVSSGVLQRLLRQTVFDRRPRRLEDDDDEMTAAG